MTPHPWYWPRPAPMAWFWAATLVAAVLAAAAAIWLDRPVALWFQTRGDGSMSLFRDLSLPGDSVWYLVGGGLGAPLAYLISRRLAGPARERALLVSSQLAFVFFAVAATGLAADFVKILVGRARPKHLFADGIMGLSPGSLSASWWSFPSGHATTVGALAVALILLAPRLAWIWMLLAFVVALGRVGATAHFVSDTVAGLWLGAIGATLVSWALARRADAIERRLGLPRCVG